MKKKYYIILLLITTCLVPPIHSISKPTSYRTILNNGQQDFIWRIVPKMNCSRRESVVGIVNDKIYALGGYSTTGYVSTVEEYDFIISSWIIKANMPTVRRSFAIGVVNNKMYVVGGYSNSDGYLSKVEEYDPATNTWITKNNLPTVRYSLATGVVNNRIYAIGGYYNGDLSIVEEYNLLLDTWTTKASMLTTRCDFAIGVMNNKIYAIGGYNNKDGYLSTVEEYNPVTNTWTTKANMPTARTGLGVGVIDNKIYAIGGNNESGYLSTVEEYDPLTDSWTTKTSMSTEKFRISIAVVNSKIYIFDVGWYSYGSEEGILYWGTISGKVTKHDGITSLPWSIVDILSGTNILLSTITDKNGNYSLNIATGVYDVRVSSKGYESQLKTSNVVYLSSITTVNFALNKISGLISGKVTKSDGVTGLKGAVIQALQNAVVKEQAVADSNGNYFIQITSGIYDVKVSSNGYDMLIQTSKTVVSENITQVNFNLNWIGVADFVWRIKASMPIARSGFSIGVVNNKIYAIGGCSNRDGYLSTVEEYDSIIDTWTSKASMPTKRIDFAVGVVNNKIYAIGGYSSDYHSVVSIVEEYDPLSNTWATKASMPTARSNLSIGVINNKIYAIGGSNYNGGWFSTVEEYDPVNNTWTTKANMSTARESFGIGVVENKIYAIGGENNTYLSTVEEYDPLANTWTTKTNMLIARSRLSIGVINNKIYALGGYFYDNSSIVEEYDPLINIWITKTSIFGANYNSFTGIINNKMYAICGDYDFGPQVKEGEIALFGSIVSGKITKSDGITAIPGIMVEILSGIDIIRSITTDYNGNYSLSITSGTYDVRISSKWYETKIQTEKFDYLSNTTLNFNLNWISGIISGKVTKSDGITGLKGAIIRVLHNGIVKEQTTTDLNGNYSLLITSGVYNIIISSNCYATQTLTNQIVVSNGNIPIYRDSFSLGVLGDAIYVAGYDTPLMKYEPLTNKWTTKAYMPTLRDNFAIAVANDKIYAIGGYSYDNGYLSTVEEYNPVTNTWTIKANMLIARSKFAIGVVNNKIYAIGGRISDSSFTAVVEEYNPVTNTWMAKPDMPISISNPTIGVLNNKIYVFEDYYSNSIVREYDPETDVWITKSKVPTHRFGFNVGVVNNKIYVIGGWGDNNFLTTVEEYDPVTDIWNSKTNTSVSRCDFTIGVFNNRMYLIGGRNENYSISAIEEGALDWGIISGNVMKSDGTTVIPNSRINILSGDCIAASVNTDIVGNYSVTATSGVYSVSASAYGFMTSTQTNVSVRTSSTTIINFSLHGLPLNISSVTVIILDDTQIEIPYGTVTDPININITISKLTSQDLITLFLPNNNEIIPTDISRKIEFSNGQKKLNKNIKISIKYNLMELYSYNNKTLWVNEYNLKMFWWDDENKIWLLTSNNTIDFTSHTVTGYYNKSGIYRLMGYILLPPGNTILSFSNYPNPFKASSGKKTKIRYCLTNNNDVKIRIYDLFGQLTWNKNIIKGDIGGVAGPNEIEWDGRNNDGIIVDKSIYICYIEIEGDKEITKIGVE
jgi:hypothetical protein